MGPRALLVIYNLPLKEIESPYMDVETFRWTCRNLKFEIEK